ncbi:hypothetical protein, partial [Aeromonas salmonicida]|uniref:hypothetical protein n=1 Tax=Aeromonas salmonicida TaxID=645 RepID=UPI003D20188B
MTVLLPPTLRPILLSRNKSLERQDRSNRKAAIKRPALWPNASQLSLTGIVFIGFFYTVFLWP